jgi:DNA-binding MarR family transcriptional regulator
MDDKMFVFGSLFVTANLLETLLDRAFAPYGITVKQWLLLITITSLFAEPPTVKQVAGAMGTSHQNVKQVALNLEKRGFLHLVKDTKDARVTRLVTTEACRAFSEETSQAGELFMQTAFAGIGAEELMGARNTLMALWQNALAMKNPD